MAHCPKHGEHLTRWERRCHFCNVVTEDWIADSLRDGTDVAICYVCVDVFAQVAKATGQETTQ